MCLLDLFWRVGRVGAMDLGGLWLEKRNAEKLVDYQNRKFSMNNYVEALIKFNEKHQCLLKL